MPTIDATVAGASSNSYATLAEANTYFDNRLALPTPWVASGDESIRALIMAARVLDAYSMPYRHLVAEKPPYYTIRRQWAGAPATATQRMAWPRIGLLDQNGNAIPEDVIPERLKEAQAELAGQLLIADTTLDNSTITGGIKSVSAGSVSVTFNDMIARHVLPDAVDNLLPPHWFTPEYYISAMSALLDVVSE